MDKLTETGDMADTAPADVNGARFVGSEVDPETGKLLCKFCKKPVGECTCNKDNVDSRTSVILDDPMPARMGNVPQPENEDVMDFYDGLDTLMLEEFLTVKPGIKKVSIEESRSLNAREEQMVKTFSENFQSYMERNGDRIDRKPSDAMLKPNTNVSLKVLYHDHFHPKSIR